MNGLPRRASGIFKGESDVLLKLDVLPDETEIGRALRNHLRPVAAAALEPDVVHIGEIAGDTDRRLLYSVELVVESQTLQHLRKDFRAGALVHAFLDKSSMPFGM